MNAFALAQLRLGLERLGAMLDAAVRRQIARAERLTRPDLTPYGITQEEALCLLADASSLLGDASPAPPPAGDEREIRLRHEARQAGATLPLDALVTRFQLTAFERFAVLACAAPELDGAYGRLYAFILDDAGRKTPSVELLAALGAGSLAERLERRRALSRFGTLRRTGILVACGEASLELRQELRLADGLFDHLAGDGSDLDLLCPALPAIHPVCDPRLERLGRALRAGRVRAVGLWGARQDGMAAALAAAAGLCPLPWAPTPGEVVGGALDPLRTALIGAALGNSLLCVHTDAFLEPAARDFAQAVAEQLGAGSAPLALVGAQPWRPAALLAALDYAEIELDPPDLAARSAMWRDEMPELDPADADAMAARLRLAHEDVRACVRTARTAALLAADGSSPAAHLAATAAALGSGRCRQFAALIPARRGAQDLILPAGLHAQVLEVAHAYRAWPTVAENWGFGRLSGEGGMKALFAGDPGTGKTLAAEVIAHELGMPLLRVELSRVVSKWVGETEKNLDATFAEAQDSQAVLLFDEADALFGKRGNVETGVDRYANLEVSHLLQRLEEFGGLVILASNLRDNIDPAFTRRFQTILHFPRPQLDERRRLWHLAFPPQAPVDPSLDFDALAMLDMNGAGVVGAARAAALLAAQEGADEISKPHVVRAIARQFRREARLLTPKDLGPYANLLQDAR